MICHLGMTENIFISKKILKQQVFTIVPENIITLYIFNDKSHNDVRIWFYKN